MRNLKKISMAALLQGGKADITYISGEKTNKIFDKYGIKYEVSTHCATLRKWF